MAYTDDAVKAKLSALNETQESIVTVAQWIMFHRRYADRTASSWLQRVKDSGSNKRLNLVYLANEVAQQSKARNKNDFINAFEPIIAEATSTAYKGATNEVQQKIRRVIEVWRQRQIFEGSIQDAVESRIDELDKSRSTGKKPMLGGSLFSSGSAAPSELQPLIPLQLAVAKATATTTTTSQTANTEYEKLTDPTKTTPSPPVHAARLSALLKSLASAEGAVSESIKARKSLLEGLAKLVESNRQSLNKEESQLFELSSRKNTIEAKKRDVEDGIMRGLSAEDGPPMTAPGSVGPMTNGRGTPHQNSVSAEPERPRHEALTPPPVESLTPVGSPQPASSTIAIPPDAASSKQPDADARGAAVPPPLFPPGIGASNGISPETSTIMPTPPSRHYAASPGSVTGGPSKKRKLEDDFGGFGGGDIMADLDDDVADLLRAESGG